ncbi:MAG: hypothetical protein ACFFBD_18515, partial [Candidatus Hodarchaeota archaeon]
MPSANNENWYIINQPKLMKNAHKIITNLKIKEIIAKEVGESNLEGFIVWLPPNKTFPSTWTLMRH